MSKKQLQALSLAVLIVFSSTIGLAVLPGLAAAGNVSKTVDASSAEYVAMDLSNVTGEFTVRIRVDPGPGGGQRLVYEDTHTAAGLGTDLPAYRNSKAYNNVTIEIEGTGVPSDVTIGTGEAFQRVDWRNKDVFTSSSGDRDFNCDTVERMAQTVNPAIVITDCNALPESTSVNTTNLDANETKLEIYQSAVAQADAGENHLTMMENRLQDTKTVALIKGKAAYIRSLNALGSQTTAEAEAKQNISEYYSKIERNHIAEWNAKVSHLWHLKQLANSTTGVTADDVIGFNYSFEYGYTTTLEITGFGSTSYQLQNGSSVEVSTVDIRYHVENSDNSWSASKTHTFSASTGSYTYDPDSSGTGDKLTMHGIEFLPPTKNHDYLPYANFDRYADQLTEIDTQTTSTLGQMETVVNQTYDQYQAGEINNSDLVDPFTLQNEFSPGSNYQGWAASTLAMLGTNQPTDLDQTGYMNVTLEDGTNLQGIIQSAENPPSGEFAVNTTYNPANINGTQWITTDSEVRELKQNFTLHGIQTVHGKTRTNFTIVEKSYETTSADDIKKLNEQLTLLREEIEAREDNMNGGTGGGGLLGGGSGGLALVAVAGVAVVIIVASNNGGRR
ncbi:hypothetical protein ACFQL4_09505 [Halosimplex aquaticum]